MAQELRNELFICDECGVAFSERHKCALHQWLMHFDPEIDSMYRCYKCSTSFPDAGALHSHGCFKSMSESETYLQMENFECNFGTQNWASVCATEDDCFENCTDITTGSGLSSSESDVAERKSAKASESSCLTEITKAEAGTNGCDDKSINGRGQEGKPVDKQGPACSLCGVYFTCPFTLGKHMRSLHPGASFPSVRQKLRDKLACQHCNRLFSFKCNLMCHMKVHTAHTDLGKRVGGKPRARANNRAPHICTVCQKHCCHAGSLRNHMRHKHPEHYKIPGAMNAATTKQRMEAKALPPKKGRKTKKTAWPKSGDIMIKDDDSQEQKGSGKRKTLKCKFCNMSYVHKGRLKSHVAAKHPGEGETEHVMVNRGDKKKQINGTAPEKMQVCRLCGKMMMDSSSLRQHMQEEHNIVHKRKVCSGEPLKLKCVTSGDDDVERSAETPDEKTGRQIFGAHIQKTRPHVAKDGKDVSAASCHSSSVKVEKDTRPKKKKKFRCGQCGRKYCSKYSLSGHVLARHGSYKKYKCVKCPYATAYTSNLRAHYKARHI